MNPRIVRPIEEPPALPAIHMSEQPGSPSLVAIKQQLSPPPASRTLTLLVSLTALLGYATVLLTGFGTVLGPWRPVPVYLFLGYLLILFQASVAVKRSVWTVITNVAITGFALAFAADVLLHPGTGWHFTKDPHTYLILNAAFYLVYVVEVLRSHLASQPQRATLAASRTAAVATDLGGLALMAYLTALFAAILQAGRTPYVSLDLPAVFGIAWPAPIQNLQTLNFAIGLGATALALLGFGLVSGMAAAEPPTISGEAPVTRVNLTLRAIFTAASDEITLAMRWVLGPIVWLLTTFSLAGLALLMTDYLQAVQSSHHVVDLFNPFSLQSRLRYGEGLASLVVLLSAVGASMVCIAIIEHHLAPIERAFQVLRHWSQTLILSFAFFTLSLAALNALAVFVGVTNLEPFQISALTLFALVVSGIFALNARWQRRRER